MKSDEPHTLKELINAARAKVQRGDPVLLEPDRFFDALLAANTESDDEVVLDHVHQALRAAQQWQTLLQELYTQIQALNAQREQRDRYSEVWWERQQATLEGVFQDNPEEGLQQWLRLFTEALLDWELGICQTMTGESFDFPPEALIGLFNDFYTGVEALIDERPSDALDMFTQLTQSNPLGASQPLDKQLQSMLYVRIGHIYLYDKAQPATARAQFSLAQMLAPDDGRPHAAMGDYHRVQDEVEQAERLYQQAIEHAPDRPEGYVGLGMLAERRGWWDEATDWYEQAIAQVKSARTIDTAVWRVLNFTQAEGAYPDRLRLRIRGMSAETFAEGLLAAEAYYQAGVRYHWRQESLAAVGLLRKSRDLDPTRPSAYWQLADALLSASFRPTPPYIEAPMIRESIRVWDEGAQRGFTPDAGQAWAYVSRALANEQFDRLPDAPPHAQLRWESIALCERALLLSETNSYAWSYLSRYHHNLDHEATALHALNKAFTYAPDDTAKLTALGEKATLLANAGHLEEATEVVDAYVDLLPTLRKTTVESSAPTEESTETGSAALPADELWIRGVQAFILAFTGAYAESLTIIERVIAVDADNMWNRDIRALCHRKLDHIDKAIADYQWIWDRRSDEAYIDQHSIIGWAAYMLFLLGKEKADYIDHAIDIYGPLIEKEATPTLYRNMGIFHMAKGDITNGEYYLIKGIRRTMSYRELDELRDIDLHDLLHHSTHWPYHRHIRRSLDSNVLPVLQERYTNIAHKPTATEELQQCCDTALYNDPTGGWMWIGARAGLARLHIEETRWDKAADAYQELRGETERFPEAILGLQKIAKALQAIGDTQLADFPDEARYDFEQALALDAYPDDNSAQGDLYSRLALCYLEMEHRVNARVAFAQAIALYKADNYDRPGEVLGIECISLLRDVAHYWRVDAVWESWENDDALQPYIPQARDALGNYLNGVYQFSSGTIDDDSRVPVVTPIVLELENRLIPEDTGPEWALLKTYLPDMRDRIHNEMGMPVPGVRIRDSESLAPESYAIQLHEVPVASGTVDAAKRFTPASPTALSDTGLASACSSAATNPITGTPGCWIPKAAGEGVIAAGFELWHDALDFIVRHLEFVLRRNLAEFLDLQEVENLLESWSETEAGANLIAGALPDANARRRFARVLQALVAEQVPITHWQRILEVVRQVGLHSDDVTPVVGAVRQQLKEQLPGNAPGRRAITLPDDLEMTLCDGIQQRAGKTFFALPPEIVQDVLQKLHTFVDTEDRNAVVITRSSELRPYLNRLVSIEFPYLPLLAQDEVLAMTPPLEVNDYA